MPQAAVRTPSAPQGSARQAPSPQPKNAKNGEQNGFLDKLRRMPQAAGAAIMAVLLVAALFAGNARALSRATPRDFLKERDVASIVEDRADQAQNAVNVAARILGDGDTVIEQVKSAAADFSSARDVRGLSRADQALTSAMAELASAAEKANGSSGTAGASDEDAKMLRRALDNFAEQGSFLRQQARAYNERAERARALYDRLPTRFLLEEPQLYEGI